MYYLDTDASLTRFQKIRNNHIYVDKSMLIEKTNDIIGRDQCYLCITKPRRFGKTTNANMLAAYYTTGYDSSSLFKGLNIEKSKTFHDHLNKHHVIYIDFSHQPDICNSYEDYLRFILSSLKEDLENAFPQLKEKTYGGIGKMLSDTKSHFIFILDEWDSIFYEQFMTSQDKKAYLKFLKGMLKDRPYVEAAYMTGVLPIAKHSTGSELNMFKEYSFINDYIYEDYFGFDEQEVKELCKQYPTIPYETLAYWYNGYQKTDGTRLFNPRSVTSALVDGVCLNYWTQTGPMNEIADVIEHNVDAVRDDIVKMVSDIPVEIELNGYGAAQMELNSRDEILSAMVVFGFLTYYDQKLSIPNHELMEKFEEVLKKESMKEVAQIVSQSKEILETTINKDALKLAEYIEKAHDKEIPMIKYNDENSMACVITLCYLYAKNHYRITREEQSGKGYADFLFFPITKKYPPIILEIKYGHSAQEAIQQIKEKNYMEKVSEFEEILLVGIHYDKQTKHHECLIETYTNKV